MKKLILAMLISLNAFAFDPTVTLEYEVKKEMKRSNILFVVDNSGSMTPYQQDLGSLSGVFINELKDMFFKITAVSTDISESVENPVIFRRMAEDPVEALDKLISSFGTMGSATEHAFQRITQFYGSKYGKRFLRGDAPLEVVVLTDESEQSAISVDELISKVNDRKLIISTVIETKACNNYVDIAKFEEAANKTGGMVIDLCQGISQMSVDYEKLAKQIAARAKPFARRVPVRIIVIKEKIDVESIRVFYGSQEIKKGLIDKGWVFNVSKNAIMIGEKVLLDINQPADTKLTVKYEILK